MTNRTLTEKEISRLKNFYGLKEKDVKSVGVNWLPFQLAASGILFLLLFLISYFGDHKTFFNSAISGLMGPGMVFGISFNNWVINRFRGHNTYSKYNRDLKKDIEEKIVQIEEWDLKRVFLLDDDGELFDLIVQTNDDRWISLLRQDVIEAMGTVIVKSKLRILKFPRTKTMVMLEMQGEVLVFSKEPIVSDNFWRNDAPYYEPFKITDFPLKLEQQLKVRILQA